MQKDLKYYKSKLLTLRKAFDLLLEEMETEPPQQRRKTKQERIRNVADDILYNRKIKTR